MTKIVKCLSARGSAVLVAAMIGFALPALAAGGHVYEFGAPGRAAEISRSVAITMADNYYEPDAITVQPGETIRFVLKNTGEFEHEFSINTLAANAAHRKEMALMMDPAAMDHSKMDHSKMDMGDKKTPAVMKHDDPNMVMVPPGETRELVWKFTKAMQIEFACNVPGHYESGMQGKFDFGK